MIDEIEELLIKTALDIGEKINSFHVCNKNITLSVSGAEVDLDFNGESKYSSKNIWRNTDPRESINKRNDIIIIDQNGMTVCAHVDTKDDWSIRFYGENETWERTAVDNWPDGWLWTFDPRDSV